MFSSPIGRIVSNCATVYGHRGCGVTGDSNTSIKPKENTAESLIRALKSGAQGIELDIHLTRDGYLVVYNKGRIDGVRIAEETLDRLQIKYGIQTFDHTEEKLVEYQAERRKAGDAEYRIALNVEIKTGYTENEQVLEHNIIQTFQKRIVRLSNAFSLMVSSFDPTVISSYSKYRCARSKIRKQAHNRFRIAKSPNNHPSLRFKLGYLFASHDVRNRQQRISLREAVRRAKACKADMVNVHRSMLLYDSAGQPNRWLTRQLEQIHDQGLGVLAWWSGADDRAAEAHEATTLLLAGVDAVCVNEVPAVVRWLHRPRELVSRMFSPIPNARLGMLGSNRGFQVGVTGGAVLAR